MLITLLTTPLKSRVTFWEVIDPFALLAYASLAASRSLLQWLLACLNFNLDSEDLVQTKNMIAMNYMVAAKSDEYHGDEWGLSRYLQSGIYTSILTWT